MADFQSPEEAYETIAEALRFLSKRGETIILITGDGLADDMHPATISGFSGGVKFTHHKPFGEGWQSYKEGDK